jgi:hypothetical protein
VRAVILGRGGARGPGCWCKGLMLLAGRCGRDSPEGLKVRGTGGRSGRVEDEGKLFAGRFLVGGC